MSNKEQDKTSEQMPASNSAGNADTKVEAVSASTFSISAEQDVEQEDVEQNHVVQDDVEQNDVAATEAEANSSMKNIAIAPKVTQANNPLHGVKLQNVVEDLEAHYGWDGLAYRIDIKCFKSNPSVKSSLKFLRRTPWARDKVERLYLKTFHKKYRPESY